jgi:hypothetical protein
VGRPASSTLMAGIGAAICTGLVLGVGLFGRVSAQPLAKLIQPLMAADDQVLMLDRYVYDAAFYLRLAKPSFIAGSWHDAEIKKSDSWRKEIFDASEFDPDAAQRLLVELPEIPSVLCRPVTTWIFGDSHSAARFPWLSSAGTFYENQKLTVWRWQASDLDTKFCRKYAARSEPDRGQKQSLP